MRVLMSIVIAVGIAALGCYLSTLLLPGGVPRTIAYVASVLAGFGSCFGGYRWLGP